MQPWHPICNIFPMQKIETYPKIGDGGRYDYPQIQEPEA